MDALFVPLANAVGASLDQVKLISCLLLSYPLGSIFVRIPASQPHLRHLFNVTVALFYLGPMLNMWSGLGQLLLDVLVTYVVGRGIWARGGVEKGAEKGTAAVWFIFIFVLGHLMANHVIRAFYNLSYETIEVTGPQMVLVMKLTTFAWNVYDGRRSEKDLDAWQLSKRVTQYPSLLEFLGYCFYFPGILVGPYLEYADYLALVHDTVFTSQNIKSANGKRNLADGRKRVGYRKMLMGLVYLGTFVVLGGQWNFTSLLSDEFVKKAMWERILWCQLYGTMERTKYYAIWTLTEGAAILTGFGFTGFRPSRSQPGKMRSKTSTFMVITGILTRPKVLLDSWNMKANVWLRECVYKRVTSPGKKPGFWASMLTFGVSAFWHGAAVGYYLTFFMGGFITTAARLVRANIRPLVLPPPNSPTTLTKRIYDIIGALTSLLILNYIASPFMLLTWKDSLEAWSRLGWYGHWIIGGGLAFFYLGGAGFCRGLQKKMGVAPPSKKDTKKKDPDTDTETKSAPGSGATTPVGEKSFHLPPAFDGVAPPPKN
ncbi:Lysophospholipid acyltransferase [Paramarasmius palmivorus]|uniref:Lysophospholipid acyltransferase n=1 Tax=Paramarasmius palmivorus TaxID=297713 RepID=A0AAW0E882_9AGAR